MHDDLVDEIKQSLIRRLILTFMRDFLHPLSINDKDIRYFPAERIIMLIE